MKQMIWSAGLLLLFSLTTEAQTKKVSRKKAVQQATKTNKGSAAKKEQTIIVVSDTASYNALANNQARLQIADPVLLTLNANANGANMRVSGSGIIGMPRGSYGFANGKIKLYNTTATTPGGITGSGSVGTGSFPGSIGTAANASNVNGKSPYAGSGMWGWNNTFILRQGVDSSQRRVDVKRN
jgi:hypothetical protein